MKTTITAFVAIISFLGFVKSADIWHVLIYKIEQVTPFGILVVKLGKTKTISELFIKGDLYAHEVPKSELDGLGVVDLTSATMVSNQRPPRDPEGWIVNGNLIVCFEEGESVNVRIGDKLDKPTVPMKSRVFFIFSSNGYEYRERLVPKENTNEWSIKIKDPGADEISNGETTDPLPFSPTSVLIRN